jgi:hypothetical protein
VAWLALAVDGSQKASRRPHLTVAVADALLDERRELTEWAATFQAEIFTNPNLSSPAGH